MNPVPLDLGLDGLEGAVSAWLVDHDGPAVVDPGPSTTLPALERGLERHGVSLDDVRHLLLTHVHLDHAGAAGHLAARVPGLLVHVHEEGAPHLAAPERLVASTRRTFGEAHDRLWGEVRPVPADRLRPWSAGEESHLRHIRPLHTPGHIDHHTAWLDERDGSLFAGDALGIVLVQGGPTHPPTPPPGVDLQAWRRTLTELGGVGPERACIAHFGVHPDPRTRARALRDRLDRLEERVRRAAEDGRTEEDAAAFEEEVREEQARVREREAVDGYFDVFRAETDYEGVARWVEKGGT